MNVIQFVKYMCQDALDNYSIDEVPEEVLAAIGKAALEAYQEEFGDEDD